VLIRRGPGLSVMRHIRQAVAVLEMAVRRAKALGRAVHHGREAADRTADAFRKGDSDVVRRRDELHRRTGESSHLKYVMQGSRSVLARFTMAPAAAQCKGGNGRHRVALARNGKGDQAVRRLPVSGHCLFGTDYITVRMVTRSTVANSVE